MDVLFGYCIVNSVCIFINSKSKFISVNWRNKLFTHRNQRSLFSIYIYKSGATQKNKLNYSDIIHHNKYN